jgi:hypothetical protein
MDIISQLYAFYISSGDTLHLSFPFKGEEKVGGKSVKSYLDTGFFLVIFRYGRNYR